MALVNRSFQLDITPGAIPKIVNVSEYDENRQFTVNLIDEGGVFEIPSGTTAKVEGTIGGSGFSANATVSGNTITFTLTESMTAKSGDVWCKIKLVKDSKPIQTCAFILRCDRAGVEAETVIGASGFEEQLQDAFAEYLEEHGTAPIGSGVNSVNGKSGVVNLKTSDLENDSGYITMPMLGATVEKNLFNSDLQTDGKWLGGSCYDSKRDRVVLAFGDTTGTSRLIAMDSGFSTVLKTEDIACNHANDMEYVPTDDVILVTDAALADTLLIVNAETLQIIGSTTDYPNGGNYLAQVAYDVVKDILYVGGNGVGRSYDYTKKTLISELEFSNSDLESILKSGSKVIERQSSCVYDGYFTFLCDLKDSGSHVQEHWLIQFDKNSTFVRAFCVNSVIGWEELESAVSVNGVFYGLMQLDASNLYVVRLDPRGKSEVFKGSYLITDGADVNKLLVNSEYRCASNTVAQTLLNAPTGKAFTLYNVPISNGSYIVQVAVDIDGDIYSRRVSVKPGDSGAQAWRGANPKVRVFSSVQITPAANTWTTAIAADSMPTLTTTKILGINLLSVGVESTDDYSILTRVTSAGLQIKASAAQQYTLTLSVSYID